MADVLGQVFDGLYATYGDRPAVGGAHRVLTYRELGRAAAEVADRLAGLGLGDGLQGGLGNGLGDGLGDGRPRVAIVAANSPEYVAAYAGLLRARAVPFLVDPALGADELAGIIGSCGIDAVLHSAPLPPELGLEQADALPGLTLSRIPRRGSGTGTGSSSVTAPVAGPGPEAARPALLEDTEVCRFTSGSTGHPQCIEFSGRAVHNAALAWAQATSFEAGERVLCFAGLYNGLAFNTSLLAALLSGASLWLPSGLPTSGQVARFLKEIAPTRLTGFPALYQSLLRREASLPELADLRVSLSSAAPLPTETLTELHRRFALKVCNYYGVAETGPCTFDPDPALDGGLGYPLPGVEFDFDPDPADPPAAAGPRQHGSILIRSSSMGSRYLNAPGVFEGRLDGRGYYRPRDQGYLDGGRLFLTGRTSPVINLGGRKVDPAEVRRVLLDCDGVEDALVFALDKANGDPMLVAAVAGAGAPTADRLRIALGQRLAAFKVPERLLVLEELPRTGAGKPRMSMLRAALAGPVGHE